MIHNIGEIGFFQLINLVRNKVPFTLFALDLEFPSDLAGNLNLIARNALMIPSTQVFAKVAEMKLVTTHPIVLLCHGGTSSAQISAKMAEMGFLNIFCVKGGWESLVLEARMG
jgi:rhodanese-related sulfurtransferase